MVSKTSNKMQAFCQIEEEAYGRRGLCVLSNLYCVRPSSSLLPTCTEVKRSDVRNRKKAGVGAHSCSFRFLPPTKIPDPSLSRPGIHMHSIPSAFSATTLTLTSLLRPQRLVLGSLSAPRWRPTVLSVRRERDRRIPVRLLQNPPQASICPIHRLLTTG